MTRGPLPDPLDTFVHHAVPPVHVSAQRAARVMDGVMQRLDARAGCGPVPLSSVPLPLMAMLPRYVMPVAFGAILGVFVSTMPPAAPSAWGVSTLVASAYYLPGNY